MFSWWILHDSSLEVVLIIFRVKNEVHLSTKGTYSTIFYTLVGNLGVRRRFRCAHQKL